MFEKIKNENLLLWTYGIGGFMLFNLISLVIFPIVTGNLYPGSNPPWYFIMRDFIQGACMLAYFVICLIVGLKKENKEKPQGQSLIIFSAIWASQWVWRFFVILFETKNIFDVHTRTTVWNTFDQYLKDELISNGWLILVFVVFVSFLLRRRPKSIS